MKSFVITIASALLLASTTCTGQAPAVLGDPIGLDVRVNWVDWHANGGSLMYTRDDHPGWMSLCVYSAGDKQGFKVLQLLEGDVWRAQWFPVEKRAIAWVGRNGKGLKANQTEWSVYLIDAQRHKAEKIFTKLFAPNAGVALDVDISPLLSHAIVTVIEAFEDGRNVNHYTIPVGSSTMAPSTDLDQAAAAGAVGPIWTIAGTATYYAPLAEVHPESNIFLGNNLTLEINQTTQIRLRESVASTLVPSYFRLKIKLPAPATGSNVYEVMTTLPRLRPIRFPGEYSELPATPHGLFARSAPEQMEFGVLRGFSQSLWLTGTEDEVPLSGVLVAPKSELSWIAPDGKSIAYLVDGALFVRSITK